MNRRPRGMMWRKKNPNGNSNGNSGGNTKQKLRPQKRGRGKVNGGLRSGQQQIKTNPNPNTKRNGNQQPVYMTRCGLRVQLKNSFTVSNRSQRIKERKNRSNKNTKSNGTSNQSGNSNRTTNNGKRLRRQNRGNSNNPNSRKKKGRTNNGQRQTTQRQNADNSKSGKKTRRKQTGGGSTTSQSKRSTNMNITMMFENEEALDPYNQVNQQYDTVQSMVSFPNTPEPPHYRNGVNVRGEEMVTVTVPRAHVESLLGRSPTTTNVVHPAPIMNGARSIPMTALSQVTRTQNRNGSTLHERFERFNTRK